MIGRDGASEPDLRWKASRSSRVGAHPGTLWVDGDELHFGVPGDVVFRHGWSVERGDVVSVDLAPRGAHPWNGSLRRRVRIRTQETVEHFVVFTPTSVVDALNGWLDT